MATLFSKILDHQIPAHFIFEDDRWVGFLDIFPARPGHALLVPRCEVQYLAELPRGFLAQAGIYLAELSRCVKRVTGAPDASIIVNDGPAAGQIIPHVHWHVVPRFPGDAPHDFASGRYSPVEEENTALMAAMAVRLRRAWRGI